MAIVHTPYGPGTIVAQETVRGRTNYKVAGNGFEVWLDETKLGGLHQAWAPLDENNSTDLPYNPDPQHDAVGGIGFDNESSTIQPIHHIDADERLHPSDSLSFEEAGDDDGPQPSEDLFAKHAHGLPIPPQVWDKVRDVAGDGAANLGQDAARGSSAGMAVNQVNRQVDKALDMLGPGPGWGNLIKGGSRHEAILPALIAPVVEALGPAVARGLGGAAVNELVGQGADAAGDAIDSFAPGEGWGDLVKDAYARPAGLSDKYIDITAGVDYHNDPVAQFRHDPEAFINRVGHLMDEGLNPRFAEYMDLVEADSSIRTAAWKDVRAKAMRLKREGKIHVKDIAPNRIMASVEGDHGTYDVLIYKDASFGGLKGGHGSQAISSWSCGCEWGRWAFRRKFTHVGRLCSHAYSSFLTMQSAHMTGKPRQTRQPKRKAPSRSLPFLHVKRADNLQNGPQRLTPDMVVNDTDDSHLFVDVTKDERKDTGPNDVVSEKDIVHFAQVMAACEANEQPYPRQLVAFLARYAGCADDASDDTQTDYEAHDADDADEYLDKIRSDADRDQEDDFGSMAERVRKIQDAVEEARDNGADADRFVAMRKTAEEEKVPAGQASGANSTTRAPGEGLMKNFTDYWKRQYENSAYNTMRNGQPSKQNTNGVSADGDRAGGGGNGPHGGPAEKSRGADNLAEGLYGVPDDSLKTTAPKPPNSPNDPDAGKDLSSTPGKSQTPAAPQQQQQQQQADAPGTSDQTGQGGGNQGGGDGGQTSGTIADGGVAGAENGDNTAITKSLLDADGNYTVKAGETWSDIAQRTTGDMNNYQKMYDQNKGVAGGNIDSLAEGTKVNLKDFANDIGNNNISGDVTNPAGGGADKNPATPNVDVKTPGESSYASGKTQVNTNAVAAPGGAGTPPAAPAPAVPPAVATPGDTSIDGAAGTGVGDTGGTKPLKAETSRQGSALWWLQKMAAGEAATNPATEAPAPADGTTNTTAPTTAAPAAKPPASTPAPVPTGQAPAASGTREIKPVGPNPDTDTYDPNDPTTQTPQGTGVPRSTTPSTPTDNGMSDALSTGLGAAGDIASGLGNALPDLASGIGGALPGMASGIGDAISGIASGLGGILGSRRDLDDFVRYAYPTTDGEGDLEPHTHPFAGSGYPGPLNIGTSQPYADKARKGMDDVTDLKKHNVNFSQKNIKQSSFEDDDPYREASIDYSTDDDSDIVRSFQASLGETALGQNSRGSSRFDDIAGAAQGFLRTAGRHFSLAEQSELIREGDKGGARNLDSLDLRNTHYEDLTWM